MKNHLGDEIRLVATQSRDKYRRARLLALANYYDHLELIAAVKCSRSELGACRVHVHGESS